jgi:hypothetical protein
MFFSLALAAVALVGTALLIPSLAVWSLSLAEQIRNRLRGSRREPT